MAKKKPIVTSFRIKSITYADDPAATREWLNVYLDILKERLYEEYSKRGELEHMDY